MKTLYLIRGVSGSGKSTFAKELSVALGVNYYEADSFFIQNGEYKFDASKLGLAHSICQSRAIYELGNSRSVIISNTSTTEKEVETYAKIAEECGAKFVSIIVENRHGGTNVHNVPPEKIEQMRKRFSIKL